MYLQIVKGFLFDNPQSRPLLVEAVVQWIRPHFGRYDEYAQTQGADSEGARDAARVAWLGKHTVMRRNHCCDVGQAPDEPGVSISYRRSTQVSHGARKCGKSPSSSTKVRLPLVTLTSLSII